MLECYHKVSDNYDDWSIILCLLDERGTTKNNIIWFCPFGYRYFPPFNVTSYTIGAPITVRLHFRITQVYFFTSLKNNDLKWKKMFKTWRMGLIVYNHYKFLSHYDNYRTSKKEKLNQAFSKFRLSRLFCQSTFVS